LGFGAEGAISALKDCLAGRANLGSEDFQDLERQERVGLHEGGEIVAGDEAELGAAASGGGQRVGLIVT